MRVEEFREGSTQVVRAEMPGIDPEKDVDISMKDGVLTIRASRRETHEERSEETGSFRSEFRYGHFTRRLALPAGATEKDVKATYSDGILEVRVPIDGDAENETKIEVSRG
jgi:HSP20 family protein